MIIQKAEEISTETKPILRWAGGKRWIVDYLKNSLLNGFTIQSYHEPFLGGGAIFFSLSDIQKCYLSDLNEELIFTYESLKYDCDKVISELRSFNNTETAYYKIRSTKFRSPAKKAAQFIYLNHYSYNGIYRVNLDGVYNVPYGFRKVSIDFKNIVGVSKKLSIAQLSSGDFSNVLTNVNVGDLVFFDPPYTVAHNNNGFVKYNQKIFSIADQYRLAEVIRCVDQKGAFFILTNAAHETIDLIFSNLGKKIVVSRNSLVGGSNAKRGQVEEYVFTNLIN